MEKSVTIPCFDLSEIDLQERIGRGNFSVYRATMMGKSIAVKEMDCDKNQVPLEVNIHSNLACHPNILPLLGFAHSEDGFTIHVCMELADKSLYEFIHAEKKRPSIQQGTKWAMQIARGMHHLHKHGLAHRDLKSANVLLFEANNVIKVSDFGSARPLENTATATGMAGTYRWMAPEFSDKATTRINQLCDVFSYGMVLYEIFVHEVPFSDIDKDVDVLQCIREGKRPSIQEKLPLHIKELIQSCWKHEPRDRPTFEQIIVQDGWTPLHVAAVSGDVGAVKQEISAHVDVNSRTVKSGVTALHLASEHGHVSIVQLLIEALADVNLQNEDGYTSLYVASRQGHTEVVDILLKNGANPNLATKSTCSVPLGIAAGMGHVKTVERLLENVTNINYQNKFGHTALYSASKKGHLEVVQLLLKAHADTRMCNEGGYSALSVASRLGHAAVVDTLLRSGADPNLVNMNGYSPLYLASGEGYAEIVENLLKHGADPNIATFSSYSTSLMIAAENGHTKTVKKLLDDGAKINQQSKNGTTALYISSQEGHLDTVQLLLQSGAQDIPRMSGHTAMDKAKRQGHKDIVQLLQQYGTP